MSEIQNPPVDRGQIERALARHKDRMKLYLSHCMHCTLCAESCFMYMSRDKDPQYMPSYKVINSVGVLYRKGPGIGRDDLQKMKGIVWRNCVLCTRCYCPVGVDVPAMIAFARGVLRSQGIHPDFDEQGAMESWL
ncbi:MAG: (Fe-S)-binding protein [Deltaproteobacteria bacterium]|nr:(Fe-S)-binding protein [Deltaproteobacteria bacterium]